MFTHSKTHSDKTTHHARQPFFGKGSANQPSASFFTQAASPPAIQRKCAACVEEEGIQTKLSIGQSDDQYEKEADRVADRVVGTSDADIQRQEGPDEEKIQTKPLSDGFSLSIQRQVEEEEGLKSAPTPFSHRENPLSTRTISKEEVLPEPLQQRAKHSIQSSFDFSKVRIHHDETRAKQHNALAYTIGNDVVVGNGMGSLYSQKGLSLIGHELAHVVQQSRGGTETTSPLPGNPVEKAADRTGHAFATGNASQVQGTARTGIARTPRSLSGSLLPSALSDTELEIEIQEIRNWLLLNESSSEQGNNLEQALAALEAEAGSRTSSSLTPATPPTSLNATPSSPGCPGGMCHPAAPPPIPRQISAAPCPNCHQAPESSLPQTFLPLQIPAPVQAPVATTDSALPAVTPAFGMQSLAPPGNCIQGEHDAMQRLVKAWCDHPSGRTCTPAESCHRIRQKIRRNQLCAQHRRTINTLCYNGGDIGHQIAERDARRAQATCMAQYRLRCEQRPPPVPVPVPEPVRVPRRVPEIDRSFMDRMAEITGLTGAALITYIIISEGSRLFPPRNLIPVP